MFENIIGYKNLTSHWQELVQTNKLPPAMLILGQAFSGKGTFALELARGILCEKQTMWTCSCSQCRYTRILENENIIMLGKRNFMREIFCAKYMLEQNANAHAHIFLYRAVMKLLRRADDFLWTDIEKWKSIKGPAQTLRSHLELCREICVSIFSNSANENKAEKTLTQRNINAIIQSCEKLQDLLSSYITPVQLLRNMASWTMVHGHGSAKIVLIENIQNLHEASSAILLKILEEPPENVIFILTATQKSSVLPTILSRLRHIQFPQRTSTEEQEVLQKVFKNTEHKTVFSYINHRGVPQVLKENSQDIEKFAKKFLLCSLAGKPFKDVYISFSKSKAGKKANTKSDSLLFLEYLQILIHNMITKTTSISFAPIFIQDLFVVCSSAIKKISVLNLSTQLVLEVLYYKISQKSKWYKYEEFFSNSL